jgi:hypothetical protein
MIDGEMDHFFNSFLTQHAYNQPDNELAQRHVGARKAGIEPSMPAFQRIISAWKAAFGGDVLKIKY